MRSLCRAGAVLILAAWGSTALARNEHCAGGIQYVVGGLRDKDKGNIEDYQRQMKKAILQLNLCAAEDPKDLEALAYLGWVYAEVDSAEAAGRAFEKAIAGLIAKGDKKKADWAAGNRGSYYANFFNSGIAKINDAQAAYPDMTKKPEHEADETLRQEAAKAYVEAEKNLRRAVLLMPGEAGAYRNLGLVYVFTQNFDQAESTFLAGAAVAPQDTVLKQHLAALPAMRARPLLMAADSAFAAAMAIPAQEAARAQLRRSLFRRAGDHYARASWIIPGDERAAFNAGSAYTGADLCDSSIVYLRKALALKSDDVDAMGMLGDCLANLGEYRQAIELLHRVVVAEPRDKDRHRRLGSVYGMAGKNDRGDEHRFFAVALQLGKPAANADSLGRTAGQRFPGSQSARTFAALGPPEEVLLWEVDRAPYETWLYWKKKQAHSFTRGVLVSKIDWAAPDLTSLGAPTAGGANQK